MKNWWSENSKWLLPTITFFIGIIISAVGSYFAFMSRLDTMDFKVNYIYEEYKTEKKNIYDVFHLQHVKITELDTLISKLTK